MLFWMMGLLIIATKDGQAQPRVSIEDGGVKVNNKYLMIIVWPQKKEAESCYCHEFFNWISIQFNIEF